MWTKQSVVKPGARPGVLHQQESACQMRWTCYSETRLEQGVLDEVSDLPEPQAGEILWLDIVGVPGEAGLKGLQEVYGLHHLALEDVQHEGQNPKSETFSDHLYVVLQIPRLMEGTIQFEQLNLFWASNFVISVHAQEGLFDPVRHRLELARGKIRGGGSEYLLYALSDLAVDHGFPVAQSLTEQLFDLENRAESGDADLSQEIYGVRRQLSSLQRQALRQREMIRSLMDPEHPLLSGAHAVYWRDCLDHAERLYENLTYLRESAADLLNTHLALISHRMNDVMKVLTIMATVFIPLSFLVGLYGMNFSTDSPFNMPELSWRFGYLYVWGVMVLVVAGLMLFFRRKKWL